MFPRGSFHESYPSFSPFMNRQILTVNFCVVATFAVGCQPEARPPTLEKRGSASNCLTAPLEESEEAVRDPHVYGDMPKSVWMGTVEDQIIAIDRDLEHLSAMLKYAKADAPAAANPALKALRHQVTLLSGKLKQAKAAAASAWDWVRTGWRTCLRFAADTAPSDIGSSRTGPAASRNCVVTGAPAMASADRLARYPGGMAQQSITRVFREVRDGLKQARRWVKQRIAL